MIIAKNVTKYFGVVQALKDVSFEINKGEIVGFLGQNGAGKISFIKYFSGHTEALKGMRKLWI